MKRLRDRRNLIIGGVAGAALLGAVALGIGYFVVFAGSSPQKLALSSPTATPSSDSTPSAAAGRWTVASGSQAGYRPREQQAGLQAPSIGGFVSVQDNATMEFQLKLARSGA